MRIDEHLTGTVAILTLHGDITPDSPDGTLIPHVQTALRRAKHVVLDVSDVRRVDSRGIGELIEAYTLATAQGGSVALVGVNGRLTDLLVITKLVNVFEVFDTTDAALRHVGNLVAA